jgi:hypothetical protein
VLEAPRSENSFFSLADADKVKTAAASSGISATIFFCDIPITPSRFLDSQSPVIWITVARPYVDSPGDYVIPPKDVKSKRDKNQCNQGMDGTVTA